MKKNRYRKGLQVKLNNFISEFVRTITKADSKGVKKSIKKASKIVAKAISKKTDENEVNTSLQEKKTVMETPVNSRKRTVRQRSAARVRRSNTKVAPKSAQNIPVKTTTKTVVSPKASPEIQSEKKLSVN